MTATVVGTAHAVSAVPVITVPVPEAAEAQQILVVALRGQTGNGQWVPEGQGWSVIGPPWVSGSDQRANAIFGRRITPGDPDSWKFTAPSGIRQVAFAAALSGVDLPPSGRTPSYAGTPVTAGRSSESFPVDADSFVLWVGGSEFAAGNPHTPVATPPGYAEIGYAVTQEAPTTGRSYVWMGGREVPAGTVPAATITWASPSGQAVQAVALPIVAPPDPRGPGLEVGVVDGQGIPESYRLYVVEPEGPRTPSTLIQVPHGYPSVTDMLHGECWWAHRGGSHSYPEHSLYAYSQSVIRGYGALEISLGRTSDGVWVGLHDPTIDRTSGITGAPPISQMTYTDLMAYQIATGGHGAPRPYMAWDELIGAYGASHVLICDPKYAVGDHHTEFLDRCVADIGADRCIVKWSAGLSWLADAARTRGLASWGYAYEDYLDDPETVAALPHWDLLGMEWSASQQAWDTILGYGVPVVAHVLYSEAHVTTARAKGAVGYQIAATATVTPGR